ncbi:LysR substrate-binding domain-containing protein [Paraburkholderia sp. EG285A]|uniref:LysR substrate-binding domain-containing protein n=1 Tax=Paraburkholderia sp. EG285A TaxID=3237009 RepID=UPI0034D1992B
MSNLPPLHCLAAFDASARYMSFTKAAQELHLSQSAVSRQISQLEEYLGRALFERSRGVLQLTMAGHQYADEVRDILNRCVQATGRAMARDAPNNLTIACSSGVGCFWLPQKIKGFAQENPETRVRVLIRDNYRSLAPSEYDVGLYRFSETPESSSSLRLFSEEIFAICAPSYLKGPAVPPDELLSHRLIALEDLDRAWVSWDVWFQHHGIECQLPAPYLSSNRYAMVLELALSGQGIALGWSAIVERFLQSGALVKASDASVSLGRSYFAVWPVDTSFNPARQRFIQWLERNIPEQ